MSKKRDSPESTDDTQTKEDSAIFQQDDSAIRAKLTSLYDTTIEDLPTELIECILVKAITMEVVGLKLARNVWKEKADLVINRLSAVSPQWSNILTSNFFRNELHRTLDQIAQKTIRLEVLHQSPLQFGAFRITTIKDELFILCLQDGHYAIHVYDSNNMAAVKDVISLSGILVYDIATSSVNNCVYVLSSKLSSNISVLRVTKAAEHQFDISPFINDLWMPKPKISVTADGCLILSKCQIGEPLSIISIYRSDGLLLHEITLSVSSSSFYAIIPKSNGNLILVATNGEMGTKLTEINMNGTMIRQHQTSMYSWMAICRADMSGRMLLSDTTDRIVLLDCEFNLMDLTYSQMGQDMVKVPYKMHYNDERNEIVSCSDGTLTIFQITEA